MATRFQEQVSIQPQNLSTGFAQGASSLVNRLRQFGDATDRLVGTVQAQQGQEEAAQAIAEGNLEKREASLGEQILTGGIKTQQYNKSIESAYAAGMANDIREELNAIEQANPDNITQFNEKAQGYLQGVLKTADPAVVPQIQQYADNQLTNARMRVHNKTIARTKAEADAETITAVDNFGRESARLAREGNQLGAAEQLSAAFQGIDSLVESGTLSTDKASEMKRNLEMESAEQVIRKQYSDIAQEEGVAAAFTKLGEDANNVPKGWSPDEWDSFIASAQADLRQMVIMEGQANAEQAIEVSKQVSELKIKGSTGFDSQGNPIAPSEIIQEANTRFDSGQINGNTRSSIITSVINRQKDEVDKISIYQKVAKKLDGAVEIPLEQSDVDTAWDDQYASGVSELVGPQKNAAIAQFIDSTKITPTQVRNQINNDLNSGDVELVTQAADLMSRMDKLRGIPENNFTPNDRAFADAVVNLSVNMDPAEAIQLAKQATDPNNKARIEARHQIIKDEKLREDYTNIVENSFNPWIGGTTVDPISQERVTKEYADLFEQHFVAGMSKDKAEETALEIIKRNWKDSSAVGQTRAMKYRPEDYYSVNGSADYIENQLVKDIADKTIGLPEYSKEDLALISDERTSREAAVGQPSYLVNIRTDDGIVPIIGFRFVPDMAAEVKRQQNLNREMQTEERRKASEGLQLMNDLIMSGGF